MSKKPYIIQQGSNNLVIVPTENYESSRKKVKLENLIEKVPVQQNKSANNNADITVNPSGMSINNNVLIDVSKIKKQPSSWASNFLQSIGGTPTKPPRLYHNLASKLTLLRKENTQPNDYRSTTLVQPHQPEEREKVYELNASKLSTLTNTTIVSHRPECNMGAQNKVNKDARYSGAPKIPPYNRATNEEAPKLKNNKPDCKPMQKDLPICKESNQTTRHGKTAHLKIKKATHKHDNNAKSQYKDDTKLKQHKPRSSEANNHSNLHETVIHGKANKESTVLKTSKGITKSNIKKETDTVKSIMAKKPLLKKEVFVLNLKKDISENKNEYIKSNHKKSLIEHNETSLHKEPIKSKSPIKSVVKKISNYYMQDSNNYHLKKSVNNNQPYAEKTNFTESDTDLRSKLKRKYPKNDIRKDEEIRDNRHFNNKVSTATKSKGFVPDEKLIISFKAESDNEAKKMSPEKTKKQQAGGKKCKKIKLQINIVLQNSNTTDEDSTQSENEGDDESIPENTDVSFLDDFNVDEIVESLNDCKCFKAKTSTTTTDKYSTKDEEKIESMDTTYEDTKQNPILFFVDHDTQKHETSTILNQRTSCLSDNAKIQGKLNHSNTISESKVRNEAQNAIIKQDTEPNLDMISTHTINKSNTETNSITKTNIDLNLTPKEEKVCFPDPIDKCDLQPDESSVRSPVQIPNKVGDYNISPYVINDKTSEVIMEFLEQKTEGLQHKNETREDTENVTLINESNKEKNQVKCLDQQPVEIVTVDLTNTIDDIETEDVKIMKPDTETESILILDTDYVVGTESKSIPDSDDIKNATNEIVTKVVNSTDKNIEPIMTVVDVNENKLDDDHKNPHAAHPIQLIEEKSDISAEIREQNSEEACKTLTTDQDQTKSNTAVTKEDKSKTMEVQNNNSPKTQLKTQNNVQSLSNNNTMTKNELPKSANESIVKDTQVQQIEARMTTYLGEKQRITKLIHRGRFSTLYLYEDKNGRKNTIKMLKKESDRYYLGVLKENMLMKLQSGVPDDNLNCVRLIDGFSLSGHWCFLMEYYPKNLQEALNNRERSFHIDMAQRLSGQLVAAVMILRNNNIIHSDIKPSHILLNNEQTKLKLCGFDQAFYYNNSRLLPNVGTVNYRAPELILGYPADYSIDVWSTALVMYEMVTKRQLFPGTYNNDMLYKHLCTLDDIPYDMMLHSRFRNHHFVGNAFARIVGRNGENRQLIRDFIKKDRIHSVIFHVYNVQWSNRRTVVERGDDTAKLRTLADLLRQMLVMHPKHRIAIEFVFANPFIYETFDA